MSTPLTVIGNQNILFGTCQLGSTWGQIEAGDEQLMADLEFIKDCCGGNQAVVMTNERYELSLTVILSSTAVLPELGDDVTFPTAGITGQITQRGRKWEAGGVVKMDIKASHWKAIGSSPAVGTIDCGDV